MKTNRLSMLFVTTLMFLAMGLPAIAQEREGRENGDRQDRRERWENMSEEERAELTKRMQERRAEYEKKQQQDLRERLEMSEEDFELIGPMIQKLQGLIRERDSATRGGRGGPGQRSGGTFGIEQSDEAKAIGEAMAKLRQAVEDDNKGDIKDALVKLRKARAAMDKLVTEAREELRGVCTPRWEGEFVVMGLLD